VQEDDFMYPAGDSPQIPGSDLPRLLTRFRATAYAIGWLAVSPAKAENRQLRQPLVFDGHLAVSIPTF
jgi:hypothetical protein